MRLLFISRSKEWVTAIQELFPGECAICEDIRKVPMERTVFVSPANCLGFMDGGIDEVYSRKMFPGCEAAIKRKIAALGAKTDLGRFYLPIGSALLVSVGETTGLICAPTMFLPHDVTETRNAELSFLAALLLFKKVNGRHPLYDTLVVTSHCCGYGKMSAEESARQMRRAYDRFQAGDVPPDTATQMDTVLQPLYDNEQPDNYDNREIKNILPERLFAKKSVGR